MTTPEDKDPNDTGSDNPELYDSIDELENLLNNKADNVNNGQTEQPIPVLDDVVDPEAEFEDDEYYADDPEPDLQEPDEFTDYQPPSQNLITPDQLDKIIGSMDEKLSGELDELVNILKDAIKESIITEIKTQLDGQLQNGQSSDNTEGDTQS